MDCIFCKVVSKELAATTVFEDELTMAFLDHRPLFHGHCLLVPRQHYETLSDLPSPLIKPLFENAQLLAGAVEAAMKAQGTFVAMNNRVSQSVPHLHIHIVPRRKGDGLKGFFWPRTKYTSQTEIEQVKDLIQAELSRLKE
ncbi:MAG TPA: HIT family protein [Pyrinomonadaceae bacterium]|nr:HIT family protein [Pyrinomonadaceae bacterium]